MNRFYHTILLLACIILLASESNAQSRFFAASEAVQIEMGQNYPNPSISSTQIPLQLVKRAYVKVEIYNLIGAKVKTLVDGELSAGEHHFSFDTRQLKNGLYIYRLTSGNKRISRRMTVSR